MNERIENIIIGRSYQWDAGKFQKVRFIHRFPIIIPLHCKKKITKRIGAERSNALSLQLHTTHDNSDLSSVDWVYSKERLRAQCVHVQQIRLSHLFTIFKYFAIWAKSFLRKRLNFICMVWRTQQNTQFTLTQVLQQVYYSNHLKYFFFSVVFNDLRNLSK